MSGQGGDATLFEEAFVVNDYDQSKYDRVARIQAKSTDDQTAMTLDINTELFPCSPGETMHVVLATTLSLDGSKDDDKGWRDVGKAGDAPATIADLYDYVCYGKLYKFEETYDGSTMYVPPGSIADSLAFHALPGSIVTDKTRNAYISFGGLLMSLEGPVQKLTPLRVDNIYLLIKK